ncbi:hypothetical protein AB0F17_25660 [Nonomuraea sp. NPDC026600]|uniref:ATP-binding protein n=1 Tax=Nonomuraea sp. NPDC026600 TaxID=3155363 RepID=UPI0033E72D78
MKQRKFLAARIDQWSREHPRLLDLMMAGLMWLVFGLSSALAGLPAFLIATAAILPLAVRRRFPATVLAWSAAVFAVQLMVVPIPLPADIAQAIVVYTVAAHVASVQIRLLALGAALAGSVLAGLRWSTPPAYQENVVKNAVFLGILFVLIWVAHVVVARAPGGIIVRAEDDGVGVRHADATADHSPLRGYGLDGMRERLRAMGGVLEAGPRQGRGFVVDATIPVAALSPSTRPAASDAV